MIETVTKDDLKATSSMILKNEFPTAKYSFVNDVLVWEDKEITKPTDEWIVQKIKEHDDKLENE